MAEAPISTIFATDKNAVSGGSAPNFHAAHEAERDRIVARPDHQRYRA